MSGHDDSSAVTPQQTSLPQRCGKALGICVGIQTLEDIIEQDDGRAVVKSAREGNTLLLAATEGNTAAANDAGVALGELAQIVFELACGHDLSVFFGVVR
jgi:hypothetical protein